MDTLLNDLFNLALFETLCLMDFLDFFVTSCFSSYIFFIWFVNSLFLIGTSNIDISDVLIIYLENLEDCTYVYKNIGTNKWI